MEGDSFATRSGAEASRTRAKPALRAKSGGSAGVPDDPRLVNQSEPASILNP